MSYSARNKLEYHYYYKKRQKDAEYGSRSDISSIIVYPFSYSIQSPRPHSY